MDCALSLIRAGKSISHVCRVLRLARSNVCRVLHRPADWQDGRHCRRQRRDLISDQDLLERIKAVLGKFPSFGYKRITAVINRELQSLDQARVNTKRVYRLLKEHGLLLKTKPTALPGQSLDHKGRVAVSKSDRRWCSDGLEFGCLNGEKVTMSFILDCCDREIISFTARQGKGLPAWMVHDEVLLATEKRFGSVEKVPSKLQLLTDNGSVYIAKSTKRLLKLLGIEDCKTAVCSPQSNGMAESLVKTLKRDYLPYMNLSNAQTALTELPRVVELYNNEHPHSALGYLSPREFRQKNRLQDARPTSNEEACPQILLSLGLVEKNQLAGSACL